MALARSIYEFEHESFGELVGDFIRTQVAPHAERWNAKGIVDRSLFTAAAGAGILGFAIPEEYGGGGEEDFRFNAIMNEEVSRHPVSSGLFGLTLENDIILPYFTDLTTDEQKQRWLPGLASGELITAIAMTEPGAGSDLAAIRTSAVRDGDEYVVNGSKVFISNGQNADLVVTVVRTSKDPHHGLSLLVIETDREGFERGRNLDKIGMHAQDTSELFFRDVRVPAANLLGEEGAGFAGLMRHLPQERLALAVAALAGTEGVLERTLAYVKDRTAFGTTVGSFQNTRFTLAEIATEVQVSRAYLDECVRQHAARGLNAAEAAAAKWYTTEQYVRTVTRCLQLHGGYGCMLEYRIAQDYLDSRITTIYGGTTEIMKEIIGRSLGL